MICYKFKEEFLVKFVVREINLTNFDPEFLKCASVFFAHIPYFFKDRKNTFLNYFVLPQNAWHNSKERKNLFIYFSDLFLLYRLGTQYLSVSLCTDIHLYIFCIVLNVYWIREGIEFKLNVCHKLFQLYLFYFAIAVLLVFSFFLNWKIYIV